jgi:hypothetical protein
VHGCVLTFTRDKEVSLLLRLAFPCFFCCDAISEDQDIMIMSQTETMFS